MGSMVPVTSRTLPVLPVVTATAPLQDLDRALNRQDTGANSLGMVLASHQQFIDDSAELGVRDGQLLLHEVGVNSESLRQVISC